MYGTYASSLTSTDDYYYEVGSYVVFYGEYYLYTSSYSGTSTYELSSAVIVSVTAA